MSFRNRFKLIQDRAKETTGSEKGHSESISIPSISQTDPAPSERSHSPILQTNNAWKCFNDFRQVLSGITNGIGPLKSAMNELGAIIDMYDRAAEARSGYAELRIELETLFSALSSHFSGNVPPTMTEGMNNLCNAIETELDRISSREGLVLARRLSEAEKDLDEIIECYRRIQCHLERLILNADLSMWKIVDEQASDNRLRQLLPSLSARYNSAEALQVGRRECTPETRKQVLADLSQWRHDKKQQNMYWLNGMAGTGKTTIANSLCAMLDRSHGLAASFFCTRLLPDCRNVNLILPTIAYQLARFSRPFYHALSLALQTDPDLHTKSLPNQLHGLIVDPLQKAASALPEDLVIVIDALDECEDSQAVAVLLEILVESASNLPLKVFVSSRPEPHIRTRIGDTESRLILHELEASIVQDDIKLYLETELGRLLPSITNTDLNGLVEKAGVLFIYAATVVRYIESATSSSRRLKRVREVLDMRNKGSSRTDSDIDALYGAVLTGAFDNPKLNQEDIDDMKFVLDTVVCAQEPLTVEALAGLLALEDASSVQDALEPLWSVLHSSGSNKLVTTLHASFPDYMLDPARSKQYGCQARSHHKRLTELCFDRIDKNECQFNLCKLESSYLFDEQVSNLDARVNDAIPLDLWYSCRYWAVHLKHGEPSTGLMERLCSFISTRLMLWMEVLSLKRQMNIGASMLEMAGSWCREGSASQEAVSLVHDVWRFVTMFATNDVSRSTPHLYVSMLACWPRSEPLARCYVPRNIGPVKVEGSGMARRQLALLGTLSADRRVQSIAISPDSKRIVSGSNGKRIRVWDAQTGKSLIEPLKGHTSSVNSVAYSPDGTRIISGSNDKTIRVWDAQTGKSLLEPLKGHTSSVNSVACSPSGTHIASGSDDGTIRVWDALAGQPLLDPLEGHTGWVTVVTYSPNGTRIVSGSSDNTLRVWDAQTGNLLLEPLEGHTSWVKSAAYSPDGTCIVSGSNDKTIRVWNAQTGKPVLKPFEGHSSAVCSTVYSPDGTRIVSGSSDNTVLVWDAQSGKLIHEPLEGHTNWVNSVAYSPDGTRIVSGSRDGTIRVWDAETTRALLKPLARHTSRVTSVAYSPDGTRIISSSGDSTIREWDAQTSRPLLLLPEWHASGVNSVAYSPDGTHIASGSNDNAVRVWNPPISNSPIYLLKGHRNRVVSVVYSSDGTRIVSGSDDNTIRVWDAQNGKSLLGPLKGHTAAVHSVAYSPDGTHIISGSRDHTIRTWDAQTGNPLAEPLKGHTSSIYSVVYSPDGTRIVSGSYDKTVRVWDARTRRILLEPLQGHTGPVNSVAYSPDSNRIVSGSDDGTVRVWDAQTGKPLFEPLKGHTSYVMTVAYSPDGTHIISGSCDTVIRCWKFNKLVEQLAPTTQQSPANRSYFWTVDSRGWVKDESKRLLFWLPPDLRDRVLLPAMEYLISTKGYVTLDFEDANLGESWDKCYEPCTRI